ncbi:hypothetical protein GOBAR_AA36511 [Gossypium barbadense]|uniref:Uncharacterized protein n=1 Tax=Gossypium barbadense TaxID=3634 RepID=A0A2P5VZE0_GOSBA|nr:hypothetical protein GOBAR_AA36511 [Gossypium barbadense]
MGKGFYMPKLEKILLIFSFNILLLPVGTVIRLLTQEGIVGCLGNLYKSIEKLGVAYILSTTNKDLPMVVWSICPSCFGAMNFPETLVNPQNKVSISSSAANEGGYVKGVITYIIMDDLAVTPMSTISSIAMLSKFNVKQVDALEEKMVDVGINERLGLLATVQCYNLL